MKVLQGDSAVVLESIETESIDLTVTSPPYDDLRTYNGFTYAGTKNTGTVRNPDGSMKRVANEGKILAEYGQRFNVWKIPTEQIEPRHPATFPLALARDHILSWSNKGDTVLDPFLGSGTTALACIDTGRDCIGIEISDEYVAIAEERIADAMAQIRMDI